MCHSVSPVSVEPHEIQVCTPDLHIAVVQCCDNENIFRFMDIMKMRLFSLFLFVSLDLRVLGLDDWHGVVSEATQMAS